MKHVVNKNISHNGKSLNKGMEVSSGHEHFEMLKSGGHLDEVKGEAAHVEAPVEHEAEAPSEVPQHKKGKRK
jgi:hypothetical protein